MWGNVEGNTIAIYEDSRRKRYLGCIADERIINYKELPNSFEIKKVYLKSISGEPNYLQSFFVGVLNFNGSGRMESVYIEIKK